MNKKSKILIGLAALLLILTFFFPIWKINLEAPQYPEGIGLNIWINQITGMNYNDLNTLNSLNHYIGMQKITPESISELKIMPYIIGFMILFGLTAAFTGNKNLVKIWIVAFIIMAAVGLVDFYMWEYNYGHNLNPHAPIKVPGMSYQPPLLGSKQLLNINATSIPYIGSVIIFLSVGLSLAALYIDSKKKIRISR